MQPGKGCGNATGELVCALISEHPWICIEWGERWTDDLPSLNADAPPTSSRKHQRAAWRMRIEGDV
jgi:hypothetical protein